MSAWTDALTVRCPACDQPVEVPVLVSSPVPCTDRPGHALAFVRHGPIEHTCPPDPGEPYPIPEAA